MWEERQEEGRKGMRERKGAAEKGRTQGRRKGKRGGARGEGPRRSFDEGSCSLH